MFIDQQMKEEGHKFGWTKVCKAEGPSKYGVNPKLESDVFG